MSEVITLDTPVPFGKYKDQPVAVMMGDQQYVNWCLMQSWFGEKYATLAAVLQGRNTLEQDACTPEHNSLQMLFLKPEYQAALVKKLIGKRTETHSMYAKSSALRHLDWTTSVPRKGDVEKAHKQHTECWQTFSQLFTKPNTYIDKELVPFDVDLFLPFLNEFGNLSLSELKQSITDFAVENYYPWHLWPEMEKPAFIQALDQYLTELFTFNYGKRVGISYRQFANSVTYLEAELAAQTAFEAATERLASAKAEAEATADAMPAICHSSDYTVDIASDFVVEFEHNNWDVYLVGDPLIVCGCGTGYTGRRLNDTYVELKPSISEDYPAILRKVKSRMGRIHQGSELGKKIVITREITATTATVEEIKQMFSMSGVELLLLSEIEALL